MLFLAFLCLFSFPQLDQLTLTYQIITPSPLNMTEPSQAKPHLFINKDYPYIELNPIFPCIPAYPSQHSHILIVNIFLQNKSACQANIDVMIHPSYH